VQTPAQKEDIRVRVECTGGNTTQYTILMLFLWVLGVKTPVHRVISNGRTGGNTTQYTILSFFLWVLEVQTPVLLCCSDVAGLLYDPVRIWMQKSRGLQTRDPRKIPEETGAENPVLKKIPEDPEDPEEIPEEPVATKPENMDAGVANKTPANDGLTIQRYHQSLLRKMPY